MTSHVVVSIKGNPQGQPRAPVIFENGFNYQFDNQRQEASSVRRLSLGRRPIYIRVIHGPSCLTCTVLGSIDS